MDLHTGIGIVLMALLVFFSLDFDKPYAPAFHEAARHPFARFLAGSLVVYLAQENPMLSVLALVVTFFWIADVNLLSSFSL